MYSKSLFYSVDATFSGGRQKVPGCPHEPVALILRKKWHVAFEDPHGMTHHILNCEVSTAKVPRSEETDKIVSPILNPAQITQRITHYTRDGSVIKEYDLVSQIIFNNRSHEVSFVTQDGQTVKINGEPVVICDHFRPYDPTRDYTISPTFGPIHPGTVYIAPDGSVGNGSV